MPYILSVYIFRSNGILLSDHVKNLANAYKDYGFNYCFMCSMLDLGIDKPSQYDEQDVQKIVQQINKAAEDNASENEGEDPNIIFLQLETFFDVNHLSNITFSENPIPVFSELQKKYSSGYIAVPSIGAGTANTEFEVVSGLSLEYFGVGEYPYKTILKKHPSESICRNLAERGYKSHAIHNNTGVFYDRNIVFGNLGFDTFTSMEYMHDLEFTETGWAKDGVLIDCITDCLDSSEGSDLVYTITVQSHGKYPSEYSTQTKIEISGIEDDITRNSFEYYVNQLNEVDSVIGRLLEELEKRDEKTVVVMFGDHLPSFDISEQDLQSDDLFQTEYVIWDNFGMEKRDGTYEAYQLSSHIMELLGFDNGLINKLHQNFKQNEKYQQWLEILEYDMLYGKKYAFGGEENFLYKTTELKMGVLDVVVNDVTCDNAERKVFITGENFNKYSTVFINNRKISTTYIGRTNLVANGVELQVGDMITVEQVDVESNRLSSSLTYIIGGTTDSPNILVDSDNIIYRKRELKTSTAIAIIALSSAILAVTVLLILVITKRKKH